MKYNSSFWSEDAETCKRDEVIKQIETQTHNKNVKICISNKQRILDKTRQKH
jgi:hypothetical protein